MGDATKWSGWSAFLGGQTETYVHQGRRYLREGVIDWQGAKLLFINGKHVPARSGKNTSCKLNWD